MRQDWAHEPRLALRSEISPDRAELSRTVKPVSARAAQDAVAIDLFHRLLLPPGEAAVGDGFVERSQAVEAVWAVGRGLEQVVEQPRVGRPERLRLVPLQLHSEVLADQRVGVDRIGRHRE